MAVRHAQVNTSEYTFDTLVAGPRDGELVLLLHGFPQSAEIWRPALNQLAAAGYHCVAPNQRGYSLGAQPEDVAAYTVTELTGDLLAIARELGHSTFHVVGHDWGGTIAWALAGENAAAVASLVAVSTPHTAALSDALQGTGHRARMAYIPVLRTPMLPEALVRVGGGALLEAALIATGLSRDHARRDVRNLAEIGATGPLSWYRAIGLDGRRHDAPVAAPTLHIWSDRDVAFGREATELTADHVRGPYHLVELTGGSHWVPDEHWDDVADLVLEHLQANPVTRARLRR